jgi:hypothetical protein
MKEIPGGFQPMNTLARRPSHLANGVNSIDQLATGNMPYQLKNTGFSSRYQTGEPPPKRLKVMQDAPVRLIPQTSRPSESGSDDQDELGVAVVAPLSVDLMKSGTRPIEFSGIPRIEPLSQPLEQRMDSTRHAKLQIQSAAAKKTSKMLPRNLDSATIDLTKPDQLPDQPPDQPSKSAYKGTARATGSGRVKADTIRVRGRMETGQKSGYFSGQGTESNTTRARRPLSPPDMKRQSREPSPQLIASKNGRRVSMSSDELNRQEPVGKTTTQPTSQKERFKTSDDLMLLGVGPSNIKPTTFTEIGRKPSTLSTQSKLRKQKETQLPLNFELSKIIIGDQQILNTDYDSLHISVNQDNLEIIKDDCNPTERNQLLPMRALHGIWFCKGGGHRLRLDLARRAESRSNKVYIELTSENEVLRFVKDLPKFVTGVKVWELER